MNSTYTSSLPNRQRQIPTTCSSPHTPPSDPIEALRTGDHASLSYFRDSFIILAGDSQSRNTIDHICRLAHPSLLPEKTLPRSEARITFWNGTFRTGPLEPYKALSAHYFYPHICRLDALNLTVMNYFHPGIRWTKGQDNSIFIEKGHTTDPKQRIFDLLLPCLERINLTGPKGLHSHLRQLPPLGHPRRNASQTRSKHHHRPNSHRHLDAQMSIRLSSSLGRSFPKCRNRMEHNADWDISIKVRSSGNGHLEWHGDGGCKGSGD